MTLSERAIKILAEFYNAGLVTNIEHHNVMKDIIVNNMAELRKEINRENAEKDIPNVFDT